MIGRARKTGPVSYDRAGGFLASMPLLYASGMSHARIAEHAGVPHETVKQWFAEQSRVIRGDLVELARQVQPYVGAAAIDPEEIRSVLRLQRIASHMGRYPHAIVAARHEAGPSGTFCLVELRRFSIHRKVPKDWTLIAGWAFASSQDREAAMDLWSRQQGLPVSTRFKHWQGINRPLSIVQFVELD
jgi:hypothetical protein